MNIPAWVITLRETPERTQRCLSHLAEQGVTPRLFWGINALNWGLKTEHPYEVDAPGSGYIMPQKHVGLHLSHYMLWRALEYVPESMHLIVEDDVVFRDGWRETLNKALADVPDDWDMLFVGSCNCDCLDKEEVAQNIFKIKFGGPMCTHCYIVRPKALQTLAATQEKSWAPIDLALIFRSFGNLNVYTVLPRLADQHGQLISE